ncbi:hypothetical protein Hanom_Chr04g00291431 [Helianthus anomalus]
MFGPHKGQCLCFPKYPRLAYLRKFHAFQIAHVDAKMISCNIFHFYFIFIQFE